MEDFVEDIARGNVSGVKIVLATVVLALAVYQVLLMAVGYGKLKLPFLQAKAASFAHRSIGDAILLLTLLGPRLDRREELRELEDVREERREQREERQEELEELREERDEG